MKKRQLFTLLFALLTVAAWAKIMEPQEATFTLGVEKAESVASASGGVGGGTAASSGASASAGGALEFNVKGVRFVMVAVQGGTFTMGATAEQISEAWDGEKPAHEVTLSSYYIGQTEVTQELWTAVMGSNPSRFKGKGANRPVECVSWHDCQKFITKLNAITGRRFRLPTDAEWEYAARGGNKSRGYKYSGGDKIGSVAWYKGNSGKTHAVATKSANELGIYDMSGNVCEWCQDWYGDYSSSAQTNPTGPTSGLWGRVFRGGGWGIRAENCRSSFRDGFGASNSIYNLGLRLALSE